jgi:hypothetical protein
VTCETWLAIPEAIAADTVALAELPGGTGHERVRIDWLDKRLAAGVNVIAARASATVEWRATDLDLRPAGSVPLAHPWSPRSCAPAARSGCRTRPVTPRPNESGRLHRRRRRPTAGRAGRDPGLTHPVES